MDNNTKEHFFVLQTHNRTGLFVVFALIALATLTGLFILGPKTIDPRNITWIDGDPLQQYLGAYFLRSAPEWSIPITWAYRIGYPWGVSISYFDAIPILAVLLRVFSEVFYEPFQYLGIYALLCFILQALLGYGLARAIGIDTRGGRLIVAIFFLLAPPFLWRFRGHFALASHWLILGGLFFYLRTPKPNRVRAWLCPILSAVAIAGSINPYMTAMCLLIAFAACLRLHLMRLIHLKGLLALGILSLSIAVISLFAFGFIVGGDPSKYGSLGLGYRFFSLNLLAPFDSLYGGLLFAPLPKAFDGQYEGYNYLGLGIIALIFIGLVYRVTLFLRSKLATGAPLKIANPSEAPSHALLPLLLAALCSAILAVTATITIGSKTLIVMELPYLAEQMGEMFRASGRLFWPAYYIIFLMTFLGIRSLRAPVRDALLCIALLLQMLDIVPLIRFVRAALPNTSLTITNILSDPKWDILGARHEHLAVHPAFQCGYQRTPGGKYSWAVFGLFAVTHNMTVNTYYASRIGATEVRNHCELAVDAFIEGRLDAKTLYVVSDAVLYGSRSSNQRTHRCSRVDGYNICEYSPNRPGIDAGLSDLISSPNYKVGDWIDFAELGAEPYLGHGKEWSGAEGWGRWTIGKSAGLSIRPSSELFDTLELEAQAFVTSRNPTQDVAVSVNGTAIGHLRFTTSSARDTFRVALPSDLPGDRRNVIIHFETEDPHAPIEAGVNNDTRELGIGLLRLRLIKE